MQIVVASLHCILKRKNPSACVLSCLQADLSFLLTLSVWGEGVVLVSNSVPCMIAHNVALLFVCANDSSSLTSRADIALIHRRIDLCRAVAARALWCA